MGLKVKVTCDGCGREILSACDEDITTTGINRFGEPIINHIIVKYSQEFCGIYGITYSKNSYRNFCSLKCFLKYHKT